MTMPLDRPYKPPGRAPKLSRAEADRMLFLYTIGTPRRQLAVMYGLDYSTVCAYIRGDHKHPTLRVAT